MSGARSKHAASPDLPSTSTISTLMPGRAAAVASAAVTVVLPTPPLPATITTREAEQKRSRSMLHDATGVLIARRVSGRDRRVRRARARRVHRGRRRVASRLPGAATAPPGRRGIDVVQVEGYFDSPNESLVRDSIDDANERGSTLLVLQVKSSGAIDADVDDIVRAIDKSDVPVAVWVGPSGADAKGATTVLLEAAHLAYISPGSGAGPRAPAAARRSRRQHTRAASPISSRRSPEKRGRDPDGARRLAGDARRRAATRVARRARPTACAPRSAS